MQLSVNLIEHSVRIFVFAIFIDLHGSGGFGVIFITPAMSSTSHLRVLHAPPSLGSNITSYHQIVLLRLTPMPDLHDGQQFGQHSLLSRFLVAESTTN